MDQDQLDKQESSISIFGLIRPNRRILRGLEEL